MPTRVFILQFLQPLTVGYFTVLCLASQAAAQARGTGRAAQESAAASSLAGLSLQEAKQILNVTSMDPVDIHKASRIC